MDIRRDILESSSNVAPSVWTMNLKEAVLIHIPILKITVQMHFVRTKVEKFRFYWFFSEISPLFKMFKKFLPWYLLFFWMGTYWENMFSLWLYEKHWKRWIITDIWRFKLLFHQFWYMNQLETVSAKFERSEISMQ